MKRQRISLGLAVALIALGAGSLPAADRVFSGPQVGEKVTPFKVVGVRGPAAGKEQEIQGADAGTGPAVLVFVHGIERSIVPLITVVDEYGHQKRDVLRTTFVFLSGDRVAAEKRLPLVGQSLRLLSPMTLSLDGAEGPGNYGLNKDCLVTIVVAKESKVTANFALVQPGIADAPAVLKAMADACGDPKPPTAEALREKRMAGEGMRGTTRPARGAPGDMARPQSRPAAAGAGRDLPGAAPTDAKLIRMLRSFIQPTNDDAAVDRVVSEVEAYVKDNGDLKRQAIDGWTRVLHLKYGTEYAQKAGREMVDRLSKQ